MTTPCSVELLESALAGELAAGTRGSVAPPPRGVRGVLPRPWSKWPAARPVAGRRRRCLTGDELDAAVPSRDEWSNVDFTVEHLEPSDEPERAGAAGRLRRAGDHRAGRHGGRAQGVRPRAEAMRGHQGALAASGAKLAGAETVRPRGPGGRGRRTSERAGDPPGATRRAVAVPGHAAGGWRVAGPAAGGPRPAGTQGDLCASACRRRPAWPRPTSRGSCIAT